MKKFDLDANQKVKHIIFTKKLKEKFSTFHYIQDSSQL